MRIQTLRGLACLLLVLYHVVGADASLGLRVQDGSLRWLNDGLAYLRMPLFTFLSGLVYGLRPFSGNSRAFLLGKARRLLIPMLVVGTLFALLQGLTPGVNASSGPWYLLHLRPVAHFWFVESLFWVFLVIWMLERKQWIAGIKGSLLALGLSCAVYLSIRGSPWLSLEGAIYLMPYFLVGLMFSRFQLQSHLANPWVRWLLVVVAVGAVVFMGLPHSQSGSPHDSDAARRPVAVSAVPEFWHGRAMAGPNRWLFLRDLSVSRLLYRGHPNGTCLGRHPGPVS